MAVFILLLVSTATYLVIHIHSIYKNYKLASRTGLPIIIAPFDYWSLFSLLTHPYLVDIIAKLPFENGLWWLRVVGYSRTWSWKSGYRSHDELGDTFILVTHTKPLLITCDDKAIQWALAKSNLIIKPSDYGEFFTARH